MGNSDHSNPRSAKPAISLTAAAPLWHAFVRDLTREEPVADVPAARQGVVSATIDAWSGGAPGPWTRDTVTECSSTGPSPARRTRSTRRACSTPGPAAAGASTRSRPSSGPRRWDADVASWLARARRGVGVTGPFDSRTAYFWGRTGWGGPLARAVRAQAEAQAQAGPSRRRVRRATAAGRPAAAVAAAAAAVAAADPDAGSDARRRDPDDGLAPVDRRAAPGWRSASRSSSACSVRLGGRPQRPGPRCSSRSSWRRGSSRSSPGSAATLRIGRGAGDPARLRRLPRDRRRHGVRGRAGGHRPVRADARLAAAVLRRARDWAATIRPPACRPEPSIALDRRGRPDDPPADVAPQRGQVVQVGLTVAEAITSVLTLLTVVYFWLTEHARLQRYVLAFVPTAPPEAAPATSGTQAETRLGHVGPRPADPDGDDRRRDGRRLHAARACPRRCSSG